MQQQGMNPELHRRSKQIKTKYFFVHEEVDPGKFGVQNVPTEDQIQTQ